MSCGTVSGGGDREKRRLANLGRSPKGTAKRRDGRTLSSGPIGGQRCTRVLLGAHRSTSARLEWTGDAPRGTRCDRHSLDTAGGPRRSSSHEESSASKLEGGARVTRLLPYSGTYLCTELSATAAAKSSPRASPSPCLRRHGHHRSLHRSISSPARRPARSVHTVHAHRLAPHPPPSHPRYQHCCHTQAPSAAQLPHQTLSRPPLRASYPYVSSHPHPLHLPLRSASSCGFARTFVCTTTQPLATLWRNLGPLAA